MSNRIGNENSSLLSKLIEASEKNSLVKTASKSTFTDQIIKITQQSQPTLRELFNQTIFKTAQSEMMPPQMGAEQGGEIPNSSPNGEITNVVNDAASTGVEESADNNEQSTDIEGAKQSLISALIALCGGAEEAKACIDSMGGGSNPTDSTPEQSGLDAAGLGTDSTEAESTMPDLVNDSDAVFDNEVSAKPMY